MKLVLFPVKKKLTAAAAFFLVFALLSAPVQAQSFPEGTASGTTEMNAEREAGRFPFINFEIREPESSQEVAFSVQVLILLTLLSLAPGIIILTTSFLRISIALDFVKRALSLQQVPPAQVLNGIALFLTLFIMWPVFADIYDNAYRPLAAGEMNVESAYNEAVAPMRLFMFRQLSGDTSSLQLFMSLSGRERPETLADVPTHVLIPSYILHELTVAFKIGIYLYVPFIIIDMLVASILMSMGMIMLPPVQISMPFKLILFVLVDGWTLLTQQLFVSFR